MKRKIFSLTAMLLIGASAVLADSANHPFTVSGKISVLQSKYLPKDSIIYIQDKLTGDTLGMTKIQPDSTYFFKGEFNGDPRYAYVLKSLSTPFILEEGNIKLVERPRHTEGTPLNDAVTRIQNKLREAVNTQVRPRFPELRDTTKTKEERMQVYRKYEKVSDSLKINILRQEFAGEYAQGPVNAMILDNVMYLVDDYDSFNNYWAIASELFKSLPKWKKRKHNIEVEHAHGAGTKFVDFTVKDGNPKGGDVKFSDYVGKGKYILVDFWASWCGPCRKELPNVKSVYNDYHGDKFDCISIACWDKPDATKKAIEEEKLEWPQIINAQHVATDAYGISGIPEIILFAPDGTIVERGLRGQHLRDIVDKALSEK